MKHTAETTICHKLNPDQGETINTTRHELKDHQECAVNAILEKFKTSERTQVNMACGTGKTITALHAKERLLEKQESSLTVVMVPTLLLLSQVRDEWKR